MHFKYQIISSYRFTVKMDDDMVRHYCNEDSFMLHFNTSDEGSTYSVTLAELDVMNSSPCSSPSWKFQNFVEGKIFSVIFGIRLWKRKEKFIFFVETFFLLNLNRPFLNLWFNAYFFIFPRLTVELICKFECKARIIFGFVSLRAMLRFEFLVFFFFKIFVKIIFLFEICEMKNLPFRFERQLHYEEIFGWKMFVFALSQGSNFVYPSKFVPYSNFSLNHTTTCTVMYCTVISKDEKN